MQQYRVAFSVEDQILRIELKKIILHSVLSLLDCSSELIRWSSYYTVQIHFFNARIQIHHKFKLCESNLVLFNYSCLAIQIQIAMIRMHILQPTPLHVKLSIEWTPPGILLLLISPWWDCVALASPVPH